MPQPPTSKVVIEAGSMSKRAWLSSERPSAWQAGSLDDVGVTNCQHGAIGGVGANPLQPCGHADLNIEHRFPARSTVMQAIGVPGDPTRIGGERIKPQAGPVTNVDFIERRIDEEFELVRAGDGGGGLPGAGERAAGHEGRRLRCKGASEALGLGQTGLIERDVVHAATENAAQKIMGGVADEEDARGQSRGCVRLEPSTRLQ